MAWIDDLARWTTRPEEERTVRLTRRGALGLFGGTATALAIGTLGDPPAAEAIVRCCDPDKNGTWSCLDGYECCCYTIPGGGGHNECCDPAKGQTCQTAPGEFDHGVPVRTCCASMCPNECCSLPDAVCDSTGHCLYCGDHVPCGDTCCDHGYHCEQNVCMVDCPEGQESCIDSCCSPTEDCVEEVCLEKCDPNAMRCGPDHACCEPGQVCQDGKCSGCVLPQVKCGDICCEEGSYCDTTKSSSSAVCTPCPPGTTQCGDTCCDDSMVCQVLDGTRGVCKCPSSTFCIDTCCAEGEHCTPQGCAPCPTGAKGCGDNCCEPPFVCDQGHCGCKYGEICGGTCCDNGEDCVDDRCISACEVNEVRCGTACCPFGQTCVDGQCRQCGPGTTACGHTCCEPPMICFAPDICRCPAGQAACATGCCPEGEAAHAKVAKAVTVEHGAATVTVTCTGGCSGTVTLETAGAEHASVLAIATGRHGPVVLGKASFKVPAGRKSKTVKVHLSHAGKRYLSKHHGHVKAKALVKTQGHAKAFLSRVFTLRAAKR